MFIRLCSAALMLKLKCFKENNKLCYVHQVFLISGSDSLALAYQ